MLILVVMSSEVPRIAYCGVYQWISRTLSGLSGLGGCGTQTGGRRSDAESAVKLAAVHPTLYRYLAQQLIQDSLPAFANEVDARSWRVVWGSEGAVYERV